MFSKGEKRETERERERVREMVCERTVSLLYTHTGMGKQCKQNNRRVCQARKVREVWLLRANHE